MNNNRNKLTQRLAGLKYRLGQETRGRMVPSPKAIAIKEEIDSVEKAIAELDREEAERLSLSRAPIEEILVVVAIPLLADVMNDMVARVDGVFRRHGCQGTVYADHAATIRRAALAMIDTLDRAEESLPKLLEVDDTLVDAVEKKLMSFIKQRLRIKDR